MWLRWSLRDLRQRWAAVVAIALVMAIGIGVYAGLGSTSTWRRLSNDESFAALGMHDLRATLSPGAFAGQGALAAAVAGIADADAVAATRERLIVDSQIDASAPGRPVLTAARLVGMDMGARPLVDGLWLREGALPVAGAAVPQAVLEGVYAEFWGLPARGRITLAGGHRVDYTGLGAISEDLYYEGPEGSVLSSGELAPVYMPLAAAQAIAGRPGQVNDVVLRLAAGADRDAVQAQLTEALAGRGIAATVSTREDAYAVRVLYEDIDNDQLFWNALAGLVLAAAALAAFNLISRIVESQRREIGIGMALGVPRRTLAIRPMLVGLQVAVLGTLAGVVVGIAVGRAMQGLLESFLPLPVYRTPFQVGVYGRAAALGLAIPLIASAIPVWRAVRVEPITAIRTGHLIARSSRLTDWTGRVRLPGSSLTLMPLRNLLRTPRRTVLTAVSVGAAITALVAVLGMLDSFGSTIDRAGAEFGKGDADRVLVQLDTFRAVDSEAVAAIRDAPAVGRIDAGLRLPATALATGTGEDLDLLLGLTDLDAAAWTPTIVESDGSPGSGLILARKAASDLGVGPGDAITVRHPVRRADGSFALVESRMTVSGIHANPLRAFAYMDIGQAGRFGLAGTTNILDAYPAPGAGPADLQREVFTLEGVTLSQAVGGISEGFDAALEQFTGFLVIAAVAVLALALLIAFNASRISVEERRREHATMRAFGIPVRAIMGVAVREGVIVGLLATAVGVGAGVLFLDWMLGSLARTTVPDIGIARYISSTTLAVAAAVGVVAVAVAPLFLTRRIRRMDIPDTLRVME
jgi:putative ABC transport system permease protein